MSDRTYNLAIVDDASEIIEMLSKTLSRNKKYNICRWWWLCWRYFKRDY